MNGERAPLHPDAESTVWQHTTEAWKTYLDRARAALRHGDHR